MLKKYMRFFIISNLFCFLVACSVSDNGAPPSELTEEALITQIASNLQSLAVLNLGPIQLMQYKKSIEDLNYSYEELQTLNKIVEDRVQSQKISREYAEAMYISLMQAMLHQRNKITKLTDYTIY
ncbi:MAG: hypothetical protein GKC53_00410 [Neisseriaceae bacterium]|nr:MAG: hypothetical protein GKC53_00410 [Neisseriaceae bacterium]